MAHIFTHARQQQQQPPELDRAPSNVGERKTTLVHCDLCPNDGIPRQLTGLAKWRKIVHLTLEDAGHSSLARIISILVMLAIAISTTVFCLDTVPGLEGNSAFFPIEATIVGIFSLEYVLRLCCSKSMPRFVIQTMNIIDLLSIVPFFVEVSSSKSGVASLRVFRVVRLARVFRLFKMSRYNTYMKILLQALNKSKDAFWLLAFLVALGVVVFSSVMYFVEHGSWDEASQSYLRSDGKATPFISIPHTFYWCIVTMTTVGYGDIVPVEPGGKLVASLAMLCGILVLALPITVLGSNFQEAVSEHNKQQARLAIARKAHVAATPLTETSQGLHKTRSDLEATMHDLRMVLAARANEQDAARIMAIVDEALLPAMVRVDHFMSALADAEQTVAAAQPQQPGAGGDGNGGGDAGGLAFGLSGGAITPGGSIELVSPVAGAAPASRRMPSVLVGGSTGTGGTPLMGGLKPIGAGSAELMTLALPPQQPLAAAQQQAAPLSSQQQTDVHVLLPQQIPADPRAEVSAASVDVAVAAADEQHTLQWHSS